MSVLNSEKPATNEPKIIIHGGAGNITRDNLPKEAYESYRTALLTILQEANAKLAKKDNALDVASHAVTLLENNPLFNSGHGAVFTRNGTHELEASVMVSQGHRKRGVGVMKVRRVRNPILLAREMLLKGDEDDGGGAQGHCQLEGETCDNLASEWGLAMVSPSYFWTKRRWQEHRRGLGGSTDDETYKRDRRAADGNLAEPAYVTSDPSWNGKDYLPQGTVGCVVLDHTGTLCVTTSTGGITNKLPGRIGDTPTLGAGFWAESWQSVRSTPTQSSPSPLFALAGALGACLHSLPGYVSLPDDTTIDERKPSVFQRAVAMSGTGNGDSFLRLNAVRTAAAITRFAPTPPSSPASQSQTSLQTAVTAMAGPNGMLKQSAEDRWLKSGEGEGGIIGIEFDGAAGKGTIVADFNCGGMFRVWNDEKGRERMMVFREEF